MDYFVLMLASFIAALVSGAAVFLSLGLAMVVGTIVANKYIKNMDKDKFQKYVAILLCVVDGYMMLFGA